MRPSENNEPPEPWIMPADLAAALPTAELRADAEKLISDMLRLRDKVHEYHVRNTLN